MQSVRDKIKQAFKRHLELASGIVITDDEWLKEFPSNYDLDSLDMVELLIDIEDQIREHIALDMQHYTSYIEEHNFAEIISLMESEIR